MASDGSWQTAPVLGVENVLAAAEYYRDVLGFAFDRDHGWFAGVGDEEAGGVYATVERDGARIHFQIRRGGLGLPRPERPAFESDLYLYVDDVRALHRELAERGAPLRGEPERAPYGLLEIRVDDPFGFRLTFGQPAP